jgi:hypothetical protein
MSTIISWNVDSPTELNVNLTGTLVPDAGQTKGSIWSGDAGSPSGRWRINIADTCNITKSTNTNLPFDQHMGSVDAFQNYGPAKTFGIDASGLGLSSFAPVPNPPQYASRITWLSFKFVQSVPGTGPQPTGWLGSYVLTIFLPRKLNDFSLWRYNMDLAILAP